MDPLRPHIVIASTLEDIGKPPLADYLAHAYCYEGCCTFTYNNKVHTIAAGDCMVVRRGNLVERLHPTEDFRVSVIYVTPEFIEISTPQSNYGIRGSLALFNNPVMHLTPAQQEVCALDFDYIKRRLNLPKHNFHRDAMRNAVECMIIDLFDFHAEQYGNEPVSTQYGQLMERFLGLLERGDFRKNRDIGYYADVLCVTSKYLSQVSKHVSGYSANYWINRYTILDISRQLRKRRVQSQDALDSAESRPKKAQGQLRDRQKTLADLADLYGFSSPSYFSRYVQKYLGVSPSDLRE